MNEIDELKRQLADMKKKEREELEMRNLKGQIKVYKKKEAMKQFDKKHPVLGSLGRFGATSGQAIGQFAKKATEQPSPKKQKYMKKNQEKLNKLINMY